MKSVSLSLAVFLHLPEKCREKNHFMVRDAKDKVGLQVTQLQAVQVTLFQKYYQKKLGLVDRSDTLVAVS